MRKVNCSMTSEQVILSAITSCSLQCEVTLPRRRSHVCLCTLQRGSKKRVTFVQSVPHFVTIPKCRSISQSSSKTPRCWNPGAARRLLNFCCSRPAFRQVLRNSTGSSRRAVCGYESTPLLPRVSILFLHMSSPFKPPHLWLFWGGLNESSKHDVIVNKQSHVA